MHLLRAVVKMLATKWLMKYLGVLIVSSELLRDLYSVGEVVMGETCFSPVCNVLHACLGFFISWAPKMFSIKWPWSGYVTHFLGWVRLGTPVGSISNECSRVNRKLFYRVYWGIHPHTKRCSSDHVEEVIRRQGQQTPYHRLVSAIF